MRNGVIVDLLYLEACFLNGAQRTSGEDLET